MQPITEIYFISQPKANNLEYNETVQAAHLIIEYLFDNHTYLITLFTDQRFDIILMFDVDCI